jgi:predicted translin family RNA/ssDNA-binding protein
MTLRLSREVVSLLRALSSLARHQPQTARAEHLADRADRLISELESCPVPFDDVLRRMGSE